MDFFDPELSYTPQERQDSFINGLVAHSTPDSRPLHVLDMDGNILVGYDYVSDPKKPLPDDADIAALLASGEIEPRLFATHPTNVRLPKPFVDKLNKLIDEGRQYEIALLTSRGFDAAEAILRASGVKDVSKLLFVADSGATMYHNGEKHFLRQLTEEEDQYRQALRVGQPLNARMEAVVDAALKAKGLDPANRPVLGVEEKGIATNLHYRDVLGHYGQKEDGPLDNALKAALKTALDEYAAAGPTEGGKPSFMSLGGPVTVEFKSAGMDKGKGLRAALERALISGVRPSALLFYGDDVVKADKTPGTDYFAMREGPKLAAEYGIPFDAVFTHHPHEETFGGVTPHPDKHIVPMAAPYDHVPQITIRTADPVQTGEFCLAAVNAVEMDIAQRQEQQRQQIEGGFAARIAGSRDATASQSRSVS